MPMYSYKAINSSGKAMKGLQDAANLIDLELHLKRSGLDLVSARLVEAGSSFGLRKIKRADLITFFFNLEQLTGSGVPLLECLGDLRDSMEEPVFREIIANLVKSIESGKRLSQAMAQHPNAFDRIHVNLIQAGEESGKLVDVFRHLTESIKWQDEMTQQAKNMMIYPAFVGVVVLGVTFFLMIYLVPQMLGFIKGFGMDMPMHTRLLLATSAIISEYWYLILAAPFLLLGGLAAAIRINPGLQYTLDKIKLHIWPTGPILRKIILARFANTFALMYGSGITILNCLHSSKDVMNNQVMSRSMENVIKEVESGKNLTQSFQETGMFPALVIRMLKVGESTGQLDSALMNVSYFYDRDVKDSIAKIQTMIEPTMTLILGLLLGWVMLSVLGPIYDIIGKVKI